MVIKNRWAVKNKELFINPFVAMYRDRRSVS